MAVEMVEALVRELAAAAQVNAPKAGAGATAPKTEVSQPKAATQDHLQEAGAGTEAIAPGAEAQINAPKAGGQDHLPEAGT